MRKCTQRPPIRRQSSQPSLEGFTSRMVSRCVQVSGNVSSLSVAVPLEGGPVPGCGVRSGLVGALKEI